MNKKVEITGLFLLSNAIFALMILRSDLHDTMLICNYTIACFAEFWCSYADFEDLQTFLNGARFVTVIFILLAMPFDLVIIFLFLVAQSLFHAACSELKAL